MSIGISRAAVTRLRTNSLAANPSARTSYERAGFSAYEIIYEKTIVTQTECKKGAIVQHTTPTILIEGLRKLGLPEE